MIIGDSFKTCKFCGKKVGIITYGIYRKIVVDDEAVEVVPDENGEVFVRIDGSKVRGSEVAPGTIQAGSEWVYRPHRKNCEVEI